MDSNWLIAAWNYDPAKRFDVVRRKLERSKKYMGDILKLDGIAEPELRRELLSHIRSDEELTSQLLCWLLNNNDGFRAVFFEKCGVELPAGSLIEAEKPLDRNHPAGSRFDLSVSKSDGERICIIENKIDAYFDNPERFKPEKKDGGCRGDGKDPQLPKYLGVLLAEKRPQTAPTTIVILTKYNVSRDGQLRWLLHNAPVEKIRVVCLSWHEVIDMLVENTSKNRVVTVADEIRDALRSKFLEVPEFYCDDIFVNDGKGGAKCDLTVKRHEMFRHVIEGVRNMTGDVLKAKASYVGKKIGISHITVWTPEKCLKVSGAGKNMIKYWPSLIIACEGFFFSAKRNVPIYSLQSGIQYVDANGGVRSTGNMLSLRPDSLPTGDPKLEEAVSATIAFPSPECRTLEEFWRALDKYLYDMLVVFARLLKEKYNLKIDVHKPEP